MATDKKISQLDQSATLSDIDEFVFNQNGTTVKAPARSSTVPDLWDFFNPGNLRVATLNIATADVLTLNGTPINIVSAPGAGLAIEVGFATATLTFNAAAYTTNGILQLLTSTATDAQMAMANTSFLFGTVSKTYKFNINDPTAVTDTQLIANVPLTVNVATGNPAVGDSALIIRVLYRIITI